MNNYEFAGSLFDTPTQAYDAIAGEWLSAWGWNDKQAILQALAEYTPEELAEECVYWWDFNECEWFNLKNLVDSFEAIREDPAEEFGWNDE